MTLSLIESVSFVTFLFQLLQTSTELSKTKVSFLVIDWKDEETWHDQQKDKDIESDIVI